MRDYMIAEREVTIQHEAAHIVAALYCGIGVLRASIEKAPDGHPEGVTMAPAGHEPQTKYSWCIFYRFPYHWEMEALRRNVDVAELSCRIDFESFDKVAGTLWDGDIERIKRDIEDDCRRILKQALVTRAIGIFAAALRRKSVLEQNEIYRLWKSSGEGDGAPELQGPPAGV